MKVIFLDVDGVLNSEKDLLEAKGKVNCLTDRWHY